MEEEKKFVRFKQVGDTDDAEVMVSIDPTKIKIQSGQAFRAEYDFGQPLVAKVCKTIPIGSRIKLERIKGQRDKNWLAWPLTEIDTNNMSKEKDVKTMYDIHEDRDGNKIPIFGMRDSHLQNMIKHTVAGFVKQRDTMCKNMSHHDPAIAAMSASLGWDAKEVAGRTKSVLERLNPYLQEALVRGGACAAEATAALRALTNRDSRVDMSPTKIVEEVPALEWDSLTNEDPLEID